MRPLRVLPDGSAGNAIAVPAAAAADHASVKAVAIAFHSDELGEALKSPVTIRCSAKPFTQAVNSPISVTRYLLLFASKCVPNRLIARPAQSIAAWTAARV